MSDTHGHRFVVGPATRRPGPTRQPCEDAHSQAKTVGHVSPWGVPDSNPYPIGRAMAIIALAGVIVALQHRLLFAFVVCPALIVSAAVIGRRAERANQ